MIKTTVRRGGMKLLAIFMCVAIAITFMPGVGLLDADESHAAVIKQGTLEGPDGAEVPWVLDDEYTVTIGDGSDNQTIVNPILSGGVFGNEKDNVKKIKFSGNVNIIGSASFSFLPALEEFDASGLRLGDPVGGLSKASFPYFWGCNSLKSVDLRGTGLFENWENEVEGEGQSFFNGCESLETLRFDFDEENCNKALKNLSASFWNCPNLRSADVARLVAHGVKHDCVDLWGGYDGSGDFGPFGSNTMNVAYGILDEYAPFYAENHTDMYNAVTNFNNALNNIHTSGGYNKNEVISTYEAVENIVKNSITIDEYEELQRIRSEATAVLAQDPFPYSADVKTELENVVSMTNALDETSTKQDAQNIINRYNNAMDIIAAQSVTGLFDALPDEDAVKTSDEDQITAARDAYDALTDEQKALIETDDLQKLTDAETGLSELNRLLTDLQALVNQANGMDTTIHTDNSLAPFTQALNAAENLLQGDPTKSEVDAARVALEDAIGNLKTKEAQNLEDAKTELGALIGNAEAMDSDLLTDESKGALETAIGNAQDVYDNPNATKDDVDAAIAALDEAMKDVCYLDDYREAAENELRVYKDHNDYSEAGKAELNKIVNDAVEEINKKTSEADIDAIVTQAKADMDAVKTKAKEYDDAKNALDDSIKDAENKLKDKDKYTDESAKALQDAVDKAKEVLNDDKSTQEDIEKAKEDIDKAIQGLVEKGNSGGNTPAVDPSKDPNKMGTDGTPVGPGASAAAADKAITSMKNDNDPPGSMFGLLQFKTTKQTKKSIKLGWKKPKGAVKFVVYGNLCGNKNKMKKLATVKGKSKNFKKVAGKKIKKGKYYKFIIVALDKKNMVVSTSKIVHVATKGGKVGNHKNVVVKAKVNAKGKKIKKAKKLSKTVIKTGKKVSLKTKATPASKKLKVKKHRKVAYESSNTKVATVTKKGVVKAKKKGTCYIYAYAQNGVFKKVKVTVK